MHGNLEGLKRLVRNLNGLREYVLGENTIHVLGDDAGYPNYPVYRLTRGICGNVISNHHDKRWLKNQFEKLGYVDKIYPVEYAVLTKKMKLFSCHSKKTKTALCSMLYSDTEDFKYNPSCECGKERLKLLDNLIKSATSELEELYK